MLGLRVRAGRLYFDPCIPHAWPGFSLTYRHGATRYDITVENPAGVTRGVAWIELDGDRQPDGQGIPLVEDGQVHRVRVALGE